MPSPLSPCSRLLRTCLAGCRTSRCFLRCSKRTSCSRSKSPWASSRSARRSSLCMPRGWCTPTSCRRVSFSLRGTSGASPAFPLRSRAWTPRASSTWTGRLTMRGCSRCSPICRRWHPSACCTGKSTERATCLRSRTWPSPPTAAGRRCTPAAARGQNTNTLRRLSAGCRRCRLSSATCRRRCVSC